MRRRGRGACAAVVLMAAAACTASETEPLPLQDSALVVDDDVRDDATLVGEYAVTEAELDVIREQCADAEPVPLEDGDACVRSVQSLLEGCDPPYPYCVRVFDVDRVDAPFAGWAEVVEGESGRSLCDDGAEAVCLRVGLSSEALRVVEPGPTEPTTESPSPTESPPTTDTPSPTPTESPSETLSPGEPPDSATS